MSRPASLAIRARNVEICDLYAAGGVSMENAGKRFDPPVSRQQVQNILAAGGVARRPAATRYGESIYHHSGMTSTELRHNIGSMLAAGFGTVAVVTALQVCSDTVGSVSRGMGITDIDLFRRTRGYQHSRCGEAARLWNNEGMTAAEIADVFGTTEGVAHQYILRSRTNPLSTDRAVMRRYA